MGFTNLGRCTLLGVCGTIGEYIVDKDGGLLFLETVLGDGGVNVLDIDLLAGVAERNIDAPNFFLGFVVVVGLVILCCDCNDNDDDIGGDLGLGLLLVSRAAVYWKDCDRCFGCCCEFELESRTIAHFLPFLWCLIFVCIC